MKIVFTGGGTAGHIYPIVAIVKEIKKLNSNLDLYYIGPKDDFTIKLLEKEGLNIKIILAGKIRRYFSFQNIIDLLFRLPIGFFQSFYHIYIISPDLIFSKGGYGSVPIVLASWFLRAPIFLHESDITPGLANKINANLALSVFIAFDVSKTINFPKHKIIVVGNPIREDILNGSAQSAKEIFSLTGEKPIILVLGGSQGAQIINDIILLMMPKFLEDFEIIHQTGEKNIKQIEAESKVVIPENLLKYYHPKGFFSTEELKHVYKAANLIVARAGSGTIFEIAAVGKPSILIPLKGSAQDHQLKNAYAYAKNNRAEIIQQENLRANFLLERIKLLFSKEGLLKEMAENSKDFAKLKSAKIIAEYLNEYLNQ